jgi:hypothetical protein
MWLSMMKKATAGAPLVTLLLLAGASPLRADSITITFNSLTSTITLVDPLQKNKEYSVFDFGNRGSDTGTTDATGSATTDFGSGWVFNDRFRVDIDGQTWWLRSPSFLITTPVVVTVMSQQEGGPIITPEPGTLMLLGSGIFVLAGAMRWKVGRSAPSS